MPTMASKLTFGNTIADWQERINVARMRDERAARAQKIMRKYNIPTLLVANEEHIRYLTGMRGALFDPQLRYVLFFAEHDPVLFEHAGYFHQMQEEAPWIKNWRIARCWFKGACGPEASQEESEAFAADIYEEIKARGLADEPVGVLGINALSHAALGKRNLHCVDAQSLIMEVRAIKNKDEINCFKMAASIADSAGYRVWEALKPGLRDTDMDPVITQALMDGGADSIKYLNKLSGPGSFERGLTNTGRIMEMGDLFYVAICGITYLGYKSCWYRTFILDSQPTEKEKDWYKKVLDRIDTIIDSIKPGNTTADAARHMLPASTWGYKEEAEVLSIEFGHGLGLGGGYDWPIINRLWSLKHPQVFEPGMVLAVECLEGEHRVGGVRLEDMIVITEKGAELMDHMKRDEILVAPR